MVEKFRYLEILKLCARPSGDGTQEVAKVRGRLWTGCLCGKGDTLSTYYVDTTLP